MWGELWRIANPPQEDILPQRAAQPQPKRRRQDRQRYKFGAACKEIQVSNAVGVQHGQEFFEETASVRSYTGRLCQ
jgi:hypothetical protein